MGIPILSRSERYVRLAPTTLYRVPDCYLEQTLDSSSELCWRCPVRKQCAEKHPVERQ